MIRALQNIPTDLLYIFTPKDAIGYHLLERAYEEFQQKDAARELVMSLQRAHGLSLNPNESLAHAKTRANIKKKLQEKEQWPCGKEKEEEGETSGE